MSYYHKGYVDIKTAIIICIGFVIGGYLGGKMAVGLSESVLKRTFAIALIAIGAKMLFFNK